MDFVYGFTRSARAERADTSTWYWLMDNFPSCFREFGFLNRASLSIVKTASGHSTMKTTTKPPFRGAIARLHVTPYASVYRGQYAFNLLSFFSRQMGLMTRRASILLIRTLYPFARVPRHGLFHARPSRRSVGFLLIFSHSLPHHPSIVTRGF